MPNRHSSLFICSLFIASLFIASCASSGVVGFSKTGGRVSIVNDKEAYIISPASGEIVFYVFRPDLRYGPAISPDGKAVVYVDQQKRLVRQSFDNSEPKILTSPVGLPGPGALLFLPNGDLMLLDTKFENEERYVNIFNINTGEQPSPAVLGMQQLFISVNALKPKYSSAGQGGSPSAAKIDATQPGQFRVVFQAKNYLYLYSGEDKGFVYNETLPRVLDLNDQILLTRRIQEDVTSGVLTADGKWLILRVRSGTVLGTATSLYAMNLMANEPVVALVIDVPVPRRINYTLSPSGHLIAYEDATNNIVNVQVHNLDTGQKTSLGIGTLDPKWWK